MSYREPPETPRKSKKTSRTADVAEKRLAVMEKEVEALQTISPTDDRYTTMHKIVRANLMFMRIGLQHPVSSDSDLYNAIDNFFSLCEQTKTLPTWEKFLIVCGRSASWARNIMNGEQRGYSSQTKETLLNVRAVLASIDAELAEYGAIDRVIYIFRAKCLYNLNEKPDLYDTKPDPLGEIDVDTAARTIEELPDE